MPLTDKATETMTRSIDVAGKTADVAVSFIVINLDIITSASCFVAALGCLYLSAVILKERIPMVHIQRIALGLLSISLFANTVYDFPDWLLINGHRPTGAAVDFFLMINILIMAIRGNIPQLRRSRKDTNSGMA